MTGTGILSRALAVLLFVGSMLVCCTPATAAPRGSAGSQVLAAANLQLTNATPPAARTPEKSKARLLVGAGLLALCVLLLATGLALISAFKK